MRLKIRFGWSTHKEQIESALVRTLRVITIVTHDPETIEVSLAPGQEADFLKLARRNFWTGISGRNLRFDDVLEVVEQ